MSKTKSKVAVATTKNKKAEPETPNAENNTPAMDNGGKVKKLSANNSPLVKRRNGYLIDPREVVVDYSENVRELNGYGEDVGADENEKESFKALKQSIKNEGIRTNLKLYVDQKTGKFHVAHGFRRMKAALELVDEGFNILIPFDEVAFNEEAILVDHFTLNTLKPLTDLEKSRALGRLATLMGKADYTEIGLRVGISYQRTYDLITFDQKASTQVKDAVKEGVMEITAAQRLVKKFKVQKDQNAKLKEAIKLKEISGDKKVKEKHIKTVTSVATPAKQSPIERIRLLAVEVATSIDNNLDKSFAQRVLNLLNSVETSKHNNEELLSSFFTKANIEHAVAS